MTLAAIGESEGAAMVSARQATRSPAAIVTRTSRVGPVESVRIGFSCWWGHRPSSASGRYGPAEGRGLAACSGMEGRRKRPARGGELESVRVDAAGATDIGKARQENEDQYLIAGLRRAVEIEETSIPIEGRLGFTRGASALLLLVADGVGGGKGGEEASSRTLDTIVR